jgi:hypothetical protein
VRTSGRLGEGEYAPARPASSHARDFIALGTLDSIEGTVWRIVCPPTSQANQGFARTDAVCPLNRHPEHLANLGLALAADPQIANLPSALRVPVKLRKTVHGRASSAPPNSSTARRARRGRDRRFKAMQYLNDRHGKLRCYFRAPSKGTKRSRNHRRAGQEGKDETAMVRSRVLLSAIFATLGVALAGCAAPLSPGYYAGGYPYGIHGYHCGEWRVWPGVSCVDVGPAERVYPPPADP